MISQLQRLLIIAFFLLVNAHLVIAQNNSTTADWANFKTVLSDPNSTTSLEDNYKQFEALIDNAKKEANPALYLELTNAYTFYLYRNRQNKTIVDLHKEWEKNFSKLQVNTSDTLALYYRRISMNYYVMQLDKESKNYILKAIDIRESINPQDPELARDYNYLSNNYIVEKDFESALQILEKSLLISKNDTLKINAHQNLSLCYRQINDLQESLKHIDLCILLNHKISGENAMPSLMNKLVKAQIQIDLDLFFPAIEALKEIEKTLLPIIDKHSQYPETLISCYYYIAWAYINIAKEDIRKNKYLELANIYSNKAIELQQKLSTPSNLLFSNYISKCYIAYLQNDASQLAMCIKDAKDVLAQYFPNNLKYAGDIAYMQATYHLLDKDFEKGSMAFQDYLKCLYPDYKPKHNLDFPTSSIVYGNEAALTPLLNNISVFFEILIESYEHTKEEKYLHKIIQLIERYEATIFYVNLNIYKGRLYNNLNISQASIKQIIYEKGIKACYELYQKTQDKEYINLAFNYNEKTKAVNLLKNINTAQTRAIKDIPQSIWDKENMLKTNITNISNKIHTLKSLPIEAQDIKQLLDLQEQLNTHKKAYDNLLAHLEETYPLYKNIKYNLNFISVDDVRQLLAPEQALISYFVGHKNIFIIDIRKDTTHFVAKEYLESDLNDLINTVTKNILVSQRKNENILKDYTLAAQDLYNLLVAPLSNLPKRLVIIPDQGINLLPFEILLTNAPDNLNKFSAYDFLIKRHSFVYNYSATVFEYMQKPSLYDYKYQYAAFAPTFSENPNSLAATRYGFTNLQANIKEVYNTSDILSLGTIFEGEKATKESFLNKAKDFRILHLATHGLADHENPEYSLLAFSANTDSLENAFLYVNDLYNIQLAADLIVLSACETNIGNVSKGEGIMSLARGFSATGAKSLFTTLWKVNDESTATIVELFFKYLKAGEPKDIALQSAKLEYLEKVNPEAAHPYYWSAYTLMGNPQALHDIAENYTLYFIIAALILVVGIGIMVLKMKKR